MKNLVNIIQNNMVDGVAFTVAFAYKKSGTKKEK